jgi:hypothetical protein
LDENKALQDHNRQLTAVVRELEKEIVQLRADKSALTEHMNNDANGPQNKEKTLNAAEIERFGTSVKKCPVCLLPWMGTGDNVADLCLDSFVPFDEKRYGVATMALIQEVHKDCVLWWASIDAVKKFNKKPIPNKNDNVLEGEDSKPTAKQPVTIREYLTKRLLHGVLSNRMEDMHGILHSLHLDDDERVTKLLRNLFNKVRKCKLSVCLCTNHCLLGWLTNTLPLSC